MSKKFVVNVLEMLEKNKSGMNCDFIIFYHKGSNVL